MVLVLGACGSSESSPTPAASEVAPSAPADWHDAAQPIEARVEALLAQMTTDEKIGQMTQLEIGSVTPADVTTLMLGSVLSGGGGAPPTNDPASWYAMVDALQQAALATRLGIPMLYGVDAVHGHNNVVGATIFPQQVGLGAANDPDLMQRIGRATAREMAATGIRWDFGPVVAVPQDVRWGRTYEGYGEDPLLVSDMASAFIRGLQGDDPTATDSAMATAKHFAGDGGTAFGSSTTPGYLIDQGVTDLDEATFRAIHLTPYEAALDAGVRIVMTSFSSTQAGKVTADPHLISEILKGELGFTGFVVSDWAAIDQVDPDYDAAVAKAVSAGVDMAMVPYDGRRFADAVRAGLTSGNILESRVDDAVRRILRVKFEMGLFEHPMPPAGQSAAVGSADDRAIAREAVAKSQVLLKTAPGVLPIDAKDGTGAARRPWRRRYRAPVRWLDDHLAGERRRDDARDDDRGRPRRTPRRSPRVRGRWAFPGRDHGEDRHRRGRGAALRRGRRGLGDAGAAGGRPRRHRAGPSPRRPAHRRRPLRATGPARRDPAIRGRGGRVVAARHGRRRRGRCPSRRQAVHGDHAVHVAADAR